MLKVFSLVVWTAVTALVVVSAVLLRLRLRKRLGRRSPEVDDTAVRTILETGALEDGVPEPLDLDDIDEQERRFWSESWDEPEEW